VGSALFTAKTSSRPSPLLFPSRLAVVARMAERLHVVRVEPFAALREREDVIVLDPLPRATDCTAVARDDFVGPVGVALWDVVAAAEALKPRVPDAVVSTG